MIYERAEKRNHIRKRRALFIFNSLQAGLYVIFLLFLSYSLLYGSTKPDPTQYSGGADLLCGFCEIVTLVMVIFYMCEEMNQMRM